MKICSKCKIEKDLLEFNKKSKTFCGLQTICKECNKNNLKQHYQDNKTYYSLKNKKNKGLIRNYINSKKIKCNYCIETHIACLEFHHLNKKNKAINISEIQVRMWAIKKIDQELNKCIVICSNCHRKLHYEEKQTLIV